MVIANTFNLGRPVLLLVALGWLSAVPGVSCAQAAVASTRNKNVSRAEQAERLVAEGEAAFERGEMTVARDFFQKALVINPESEMAHTHLGMLADKRVISRRPRVILAEPRASNHHLRRHETTTA